MAPATARPLDGRGTFTSPLRGSQLFWSSEGQGEPTTLLCDGLGCDGFIWRYLQPALAEAERVLPGTTLATDVRPRRRTRRG